MYLDGPGKILAGIYYAFYVQCTSHMCCIYVRYDLPQVTLNDLAWTRPLSWGFSGAAGLSASVLKHTVSLHLEPPSSLLAWSCRCKRIQSRISTVQKHNCLACTTTVVQNRTFQTTKYDALLYQAAQIAHAAVTYPKFIACISAKV